MPAVADALDDPVQVSANPQLQAALRCELDRIGVARLNLAVAQAAADRSRVCAE